MIYKSSLIISCCLSICLSTGFAQCDKWIGKANEEELKGSHSIYRASVKAKRFQEAFDFWQQCYEQAPAADGKRDFHFTDGIKIYKAFHKEASDDAKKAEYLARIMELYDGVENCYREGAITLRNCDGGTCLDEYLGRLRGRQAYSMYYEFRAPTDKTYEVSKKAVELSGLNTEYVVITPFANTMVMMFEADRIEVAEVRKNHQKLIEICEYNIENNETYGAYYEQALAAMQGAMARIEMDVYDCQYFKEKLVPEYEMNKDDGKRIKEIYTVLIRQGCDTADPILVEMNERYKVYAAEVNAKLRAEMEEKNPSLAGKRLYDEGNYTAAVAKYKEAIEKEDDPERKADYYFRLASIQGRKLNQYSAARSNALKAADLKSDWGRPYMLIGDLYAVTSRNCGDSFNQRLAVLAAIDKYAYAKNIDPEMAEEANSKISRYNGSKPSKDEAFMRGHDEGDRLKVGCWIAETVSLRF